MVKYASGCLKVYVLTWDLRPPNMILQSYTTNTLTPNTVFKEKQLLISQSFCSWPVGIKLNTPEWILKEDKFHFNAKLFWFLDQAFKILSLLLKVLFIVINYLWSTYTKTE